MAINAWIINLLGNMYRDYYRIQYLARVRWNKKKKEKNNCIGRVIGEIF